jgi:hypothetical protein
MTPARVGWGTGIWARRGSDCNGLRFEVRAALGRVRLGAQSYMVSSQLGQAPKAKSNTVGASASLAPGTCRQGKSGQRLMEQVHPHRLATDMCLPQPCVSSAPQPHKAFKGLQGVQEFCTCVRRLSRRSTAKCSTLQGFALVCRT